MSKYTKGWRYEDIIRKEFEKQNCYVVRSAGSKGLWDIVAISDHFIFLIQSKLNSLPTPKEREAMEDFKCPANCIKQIWIFRGRGKREIWTWVSGEWIKKKVTK